jgi:hypothetical protein
MYYADPMFPKPDNAEAVVWRYTDIVKFISLIDTKSLFFSRSDLLGDPFEGSIPYTDGQINLNELIRETYATLGLEKPPSPLSFSIHDFLRKSAYVCSFHMNSFESAALWSIYTKAKQGVAIRTTFSRLCNCFNDYQDEKIRIGLIDYIDYKTQTIPVLKNAYFPLIYKRKSFEHERELRAILISTQNVLVHGQTTLTQEKIDHFPKGISVPVDLNTLIERIYIAPTSPSWIKELLTSVLRKYRINKTVYQSTLDRSPII